MLLSSLFILISVSVSSARKEKLAKVASNTPDTPDTPNALPDTPVTQKPMSDTPKTLKQISDTPVNQKPVSDTYKTLKQVADAPDTLNPVSETPKTLKPESDTPKTLLESIKPLPDTTKPDSTNLSLAGPAKAKPILPPLLPKASQASVQSKSTFTPAKPSETGLVSQSNLTPVQ